MISVLDITLLLLAHFVGDFVLQSDWMAQGKSVRYGFNKNMAVHIGIVTACLLPFGIVFALVNGVIHWALDAISSQMTRYYWRKDERHNFFVVIGADQMLHYLTLFYTYLLLN